MPESIEEQTSRFVVRDENGQVFAYVYYEDEPGRRLPANLPSKDEARRMAISFAKLAEISSVSLGVDPATLRACDAPVVAKVSWNVATPNTKRVDLFFLENGHEKLVSGWNEVVGSTNTGAWVHPGAVFALRDTDTKKLLATVAVGSR